MQFLLDTRADELNRKAAKFPGLIAGQLLSPLTRYSSAGGMFGVDNGAFSTFNKSGFVSLLTRERDAGRRDNRCLFVAVPDVVGSARRTLEAFDACYHMVEGWPVAIVAQDGLEDLEIPWRLIKAIFIGGSTEWKMSQSAKDIIKTAKIIGVHTHVGRVNTPKRFKVFADAGVDTCDGSGASRFDWMLEKIYSKQFDDLPLFKESPTG